MDRNSDGDMPLKVVDRRRIHYDRTTGDVRYRENSGEYEGQKRTRGSSGKRPAPQHAGAATPQNYGDAAHSSYRGASETHHNVSRNSHPVSSGHGMPKWLYIPIAGAALYGLFLVGQSQRNTSHTPRQSAPVVQTAPEAQQSAIQPTVSIPPSVELNINRAAFDEHQMRVEEKYRDFEASAPITPIKENVPLHESIQLPPEVNWVRNFTLDLEGDGNEEIYIIGCVRDGNGNAKYCPVHHIYQNNGNGYVVIFDIQPHKVSSRHVNGKPVVYNSISRNITVPVPYSQTLRTEYIWNGQKYVKSDEFADLEDISRTAECINEYLTGQSPASINQFMRELEATIGTDHALRAFLQAQAPPGFTMPTGSEYVEYVRQYAMELERVSPGMGERALTRYADDPAGFFRNVYSRSSDPMFLDLTNPRSIAAVSLGLTLRHLGRSEWDQHMDRWNRAQGGAGFIGAFRNSTGRYPQSESELWSAMNNVVREDKLRVAQGQNPLPYRPEQPGGIRTYQSGPVVGDPRYQQWNPQTPSAQERAEQIDRQSQQAIQQGAERARQLGNQLQNKVQELFKKKDKE